MGVALEQLRELHDAGLALIPVGADKRPLFRWKQYQSERPTWTQIDDWFNSLDPSAWAVITGAISGIDVLDFDGDAGLSTLKRLGLDPTVTTGSGGVHVWVRHPDGDRVRTTSQVDARLRQTFPGVDLRGDGGYAITVGTSTKGDYELHDRWRAPVSIDDLPEDLRRLMVGEPETDSPRDEPGPPSRSDLDDPLEDDFYVALVEEALAKTRDGGRNEAGLWLACQLRDDGLPAQDARLVMSVYASMCPTTNVRGEPEPYTEAEAMATLEQAYSRPPRAPHPSRRRSDLPAIVVNDTQLRDLMDDVRDAILAANEPPGIFRRFGVLVHLRQADEGRLQVMPVDTDGLRAYAARSADFYREKQSGGETVLQHARPPVDAIRALDGEARWPGVPLLAGITATPVLRDDGTIHDTEGYDPNSGYYYSPVDGFVLPDLPETPTHSDCQAALRLLRDELLADFPFVDEASAANALALVLTNVLRVLVRGLVPLALVNAPQAGTGKTALAELSCLVGSGTGASLSTLPHNDEELRKRLTALLMGGSSTVILDNLEQKLVSATLAGMLTTKWWSDRILGKSKIVRVKNDAVWICTGNNLTLGGDLARRSFAINLDARTARPWQRDFARPDLLGWALEHRAEIVGAAFVLARAWIRAGRPPGTRRQLGSFQNWADVIGGILDFHGVPGFLGNLDQLYEKADTDREAWEGFLLAWLEQYGSRECSTAEVDLSIAGQTGSVYEAVPAPLAEALDRAGGDRSRRGRLGKQLAGIVDRRFNDDGLRLERVADDSHSKTARWRVVTDMPYQAHVAGKEE